MRQPGFRLLIAILLLSNGLWLYWWISTTAVVHYHEVEIETQREMIDLLSTLALALPRDKDLPETLRFLTTTFPTHLVKQVDEHTLSIDDVLLKFVSGRVAEVKRL
jgi:hypothetical protein